MKKIIYCLLILIMFVFLGCASTSYYIQPGSTVKEKIEEIPLSGKVRVELRASNSKIYVLGMDVDKVMLYGEYRSLDHDPGNLEIRIENQTEFYIVVPFFTEIEISNSNGKLYFLDTRGDLDSKSSNTEVMAINPGKEVEIKTTNSGITLINFEPTIEDYELSTTNAPINLGIPEMDLELEIATTNAGFDITNLPFQTMERSKNKIKGFIGNKSESKVELDTTNNLITLKPARQLGLDFSDRINKVTEKIEKVFSGYFINQAAVVPDITDGFQHVQEKSPGVDVPKRLVIFPFKDLTESARVNNIGEVVSEMLTTAIVNEDKFIVIERTHLDQVLEEHAFQLSDIADTENSLDIGNILNAELLLAGSVSSFGERVEIDIRLIKIETGEIVLSKYGSSTFENLREVLTKIAVEISVTD